MCPHSRCPLSLQGTESPSPARLDGYRGHSRPEQRQQVLLQEFPRRTLRTLDPLPHNPWDPSFLALVLSWAPCTCVNKQGFLDVSQILRAGSSLCGRPPPAAPTPPQHPPGSLQPAARLTGSWENLNSLAQSSRRFASNPSPSSAEPCVSCGVPHGLTLSHICACLCGPMPTPVPAPVPCPRTPQGGAGGAQASM